jgi:hypothetical protein
MSFHFDPLIGNQSKIIQYNSDVNRVLIFMNPVSIKEIEFGGYQTIPSSLILMEPSSYQIIQINTADQVGLKEGFQEGYEVMDCQLVDDKGTPQGNKTITKLVENDSPDNKIIGIIFSIFMVMTIGWFAAPPLYKSIVINQYKTSESITFATVFIGIVILALGASLFGDGLSKKYHDTTESYFGTMILFLLVVSYVSIAINRLDTTFNTGPSLNFKTLGSGFISMLTGVFAMLIEIKYVFGQIKPTIIVGILPLFSLLLIILSIVCFVGIKNDPDVKKKEKKQKGYIKHLIGLIMGIGSIYGFMLILYYFHMNPIPTSYASV